jgi:hypothetical protein
MIELKCEIFFYKIMSVKFTLTKYSEVFFFMNNY